MTFPLVTQTPPSDELSGTTYPLEFLARDALLARAHDFASPPLSLEDGADSRLPETVRARLPQAQAYALAAVARAAASQTKRQAGLASRFAALQRSNRNTEHRLEELRQLGDAYTQEVSKVSACRTGCSHCCHIPVFLSASEAKLIGKQIGRRPVNLPAGEVHTPGAYGYDRPCTFLKDSRCSIYEHRPMACRWHFNLDRDALLCELIPELSVPVPLADMRSLQILYTQVTFGDTIADVRDFFPQKAKMPGAPRHT